MKRGFQIAIDGPVASGKGTVSKRLAERLKFLYIDTGAMYRVATFLAIENNLEMSDEKGIARLVKESKIEMRDPTIEEQDGRLSTVVVNGRDVSREIRNNRITERVAMVAVLASVRKELVDKQQKITENRDVVMEGRDIASVVLPNADLKIYLDARENIRIDRRYKELSKGGKKVNKKEVVNSLRSRDKADQERRESPLKIRKGVWYLDTSDLMISEVVDCIEERVKVSVKQMC